MNFRITLIQGVEGGVGVGAVRERGLSGCVGSLRAQWVAPVTATLAKVTARGGVGEKKFTAASEISTQ